MIFLLENYVSGVPLLIFCTPPYQQNLEVEKIQGIASAQRPYLSHFATDVYRMVEQ